MGDISLRSRVRRPDNLREASTIGYLPLSRERQACSGRFDKRTVSEGSRSRNLQLSALTSKPQLITTAIIIKVFESMLADAVVDS